MITKKLKNLLVIALVLIYLHGFEEILTGFQYNDIFMVSIANLFATQTLAVYWVLHIVFWLLLPLFILLAFDGKWKYIPLAIFGLIWFVEIHHLVKALIAMSYYPGMVTAFFYPIFGVFYWRELYNNWITIKRKKR